MRNYRIYFISERKGGKEKRKSELWLLLPRQKIEHVKQSRVSSLVEEKKEDFANQDLSKREPEPKQTTPIIPSEVQDDSAQPSKVGGFVVRLCSATAHIILVVLFLTLATALCLDRIDEDYLYPQMKLMEWAEAERDFAEVTYYHRYCDGSDLTTTSVDQLVIPENAPTQDTVNHMLTHGASMYPNLLTNDTAAQLREFIDAENRRQQGWHVIENENRYSWGIDMKMQPALQTYWKELASNPVLVKALQAIVGPDPAVIEFTAITSSYGAVDQYDHQDVVPRAAERNLRGPLFHLIRLSCKFRCTLRHIFLW